MIRFIAFLVSTALAGLVGPAWAGSGTVNYNSSGSAAFATTTDGSGNNYGRQTLWDYSAGANGLAITPSHGLYANVEEWGAAVLGAATAVGTEASGNVPTVNAHITNTPAVSQSGTWTVQPGNTANTTAWKVDGSSVIQPVSAASLPLPDGAAADSSLTTLHNDLTTLNTTAGGAIPVGANVIGKVSIDQTTPNTTNLVATTPVNGDPCQTLTPHYVAINLTASTQIIAGTSAKKTYICKISLVPGAAVNVALVEGTGAVCVTNTYGLEGGATAATGWNFASAGNGIIEGNGVASAIGPPDGDANATAANLCLLLSGAVQVSGQVKYVQN